MRNPRAPIHEAAAARPTTEVTSLAHEAVRKDGAFQWGSR